MGNRIESYGFEKKKNNKIFVWGTGTYGDLAYFGLQSLNQLPDGFIESIPTKTEHRGIKVYSPEILVGDDNSIVVVAVFHHFEKIIGWLDSHGITKRYDMLSLLKLEYDTSELTYEARKEKLEWWKYEHLIEMNNDDKNIVLTHCELTLTEKCSLRCKECADLMPYYSEPKNIEYADIIEWLDRLLRVVDTITNLKLIGGEPFVYDRLNDVINYVTCNSKIDNVSINTNGTIVPPENVLDSLSSPKVTVYISDYDKLSRNKEALVHALEERHIRYNIGTPTWGSFGTLEKRNLSIEANDRKYTLCMTSRCHTLYRGKLYHCPRAAHGEKLGFFTNGQGEVLDFTKETFSESDMKFKMKEWLKNTSGIQACDYCDGLPSNYKHIPVAQQLREK